MTVTIAAVLLGVAVQLVALWRMGSRRPIGDEGTYLERGRSEDPHAPRLFLRTPGLPWLAALCHSGGGAWDPARGEARLRLLMAIASSLTLGLTAIAGWRLGGTSLAVLAVLLLGGHPERILLGCHIWPDTLLAATLAALMVTSTLPGGPATALLAGGLCALGVLIRIDFAFAPPLFLAAWWAASGPPAPVAVAALLAPPLIALVLFSVRNSRRYGIPLPDTTWAFNLMVTGAAASPDRGDRTELTPTVREVLAVWTGLRPMEATRRGVEALGEALRSPVRLVRGIGRRFLVLVGPDTFVRQTLLPRTAAYPDLGERPRRWWEASLRVASPLLFAVILTGAVVGHGAPAAFAWPSFGLAAAAILFHSRTRFRVTLLPALSLIAAQDILRFGELLTQPLSAVLVAAGALALFWALLHIRCSNELRPDA